MDILENNNDDAIDDTVLPVAVDDGLVESQVVEEDQVLEEASEPDVPNRIQEPENMRDNQPELDTSNLITRKRKSIASPSDVEHTKRKSRTFPDCT